MHGGMPRVSLNTMHLKQIASAMDGAKALQPLLGPVRWAAPLSLTVYLVYRLSCLGWTQVWASRPSGALFYAVLLLPFFVQPLTDLAIYRKLLSVGRDLPLTVLLRKRFLNNIMLEYAGEAYFFLWARDHLPVSQRGLFHAVKDSNILSGGAGLVTVWLVLLALLSAGNAPLPAMFTENAWKLGFVAALPLILSVSLVILGRRATSLTRRQIAMTFLAHLLRSITVLALEFLLWRLSGALPSTALCLRFIGLHLVVTRLPLIPRKDLLFVGLGVAAAGAMNANTSAVAAVLILLTATEQVLELAIVGVPWLLETRVGRISSPRREVTLRRNARLG
jgi:hypothetical protein